MILVLLTALLLRLPLLSQSFWLDEAAQALESVRPLSQQLVLSNDFQPPLYHLLVYLFALISHADWWLRLASLIPGIITIYFTYKLGGRFAAILLTTSQFHIFYSQELRPYSLATMFAVLSMYRLLIILKKRRFDWLYLFFTTLGLYTVYTFPFLLLAQLFYVLIFHRNLLRSIIYHLSSIILLCLPWLPSLWQQFQTGMGVAHTLPLWRTVVSPPALKALALVFPKFVFGYLPLPNPLIQLLPLILILGLVGFLIIQVRQKLLLIWLGLPLLFGFLVSFPVPLLDPKRFLFCLPALYLLIALSKSRLKHALILLNLISVFLYWFNPQFQREPWRLAVKQVETIITPQTILIFPWNGPYAPWTWYARLPTRQLSFDILPLTTTTVDQKLATLSSTDQIIVFDYLQDLTDPGRILLTTLARQGWRESGFYQYPGLGKIRILNKTPVYALESVQ